MQKRTTKFLNDLIRINANFNFPIIALVMHLTFFTATFDVMKLVFIIRQIFHFARYFKTSMTSSKYGLTF